MQVLLNTTRECHTLDTPLCLDAHARNIDNLADLYGAIQLQ